MKTLNEIAEITEVVDVSTLLDDSKTKTSTNNEFDSITLLGYASYLDHELTIQVQVFSTRMKIENLEFPVKFNPKNENPPNVEMRYNNGGPVTNLPYIVHEIKTYYDVSSKPDSIELTLNEITPKGVITRRRTKVIVQNGTDPILGDFSQSKKD